jgi:hypothetical protein
MKRQAKEPRDPRTPREWQEAVDAAAALMIIHSARLYGLITGGPHANVERCDDILTRGAARKVYPSKPAADLAIEMNRSTR